MSDLSCSAKRSAAEGEPAELSIFLLLPVPHSFPFIGIHSCVDIYAIFRFEPMHPVSHGISRLLEECLVNYLGDCERTSNRTLTKIVYQKLSNKPKMSQFLPSTLFYVR